MTATCARCTRPMPDQAYACSSCAYRAGDQLHEIADMAPAARDVAHGFARRGTGGASGKPGSSLPFDLGATSKLDHVQARLSTWVGEVAYARNRPIPAPRYLGDDPVVLWARWLAGHVEWLRHTDDAERFLIEVDECMRAVRSVTRGPASQKYLGPCGAPRQVDVTPIGRMPGTEFVDGALCEGDIYAHRGARVGRCWTCGAEVAAGDREAWLDAEVRTHAFRAAHIAEAYRVNVNTIRSWAARGQLKSYWRTDGGIVADWTEPAEGETRERLHYVGDVLDLAAADAARRATEQAKRARRAAVKAAESEDAA
jgi:hypothetical protein